MSSWIRKASRIQRQDQISNQIDELLNGLDLSSNEHYVNTISIKMILENGFLERVYGLVEARVWT
ncbi:hypothetical protein [Prochlorococcus sp. MIT 0801]|uniref:hypothetical protein n=1 Tax=Prochlorococcus sp. MIT 0801 TaxID=1501269 RepID=UPI0004F7BE51|nr:hypothetical protein [Prochlorococcus sp. MIT 0801]AIQ96205.1 hypothetical protein EW15_0113 [Prochlorococcus sp. MIT 0801]